MTEEQMLERIENIGAHMFDAVGGDGNTPLCDVLSAELGIDPNDDEAHLKVVHGLFAGITKAGTSFGFVMASQYVAYAFTIGRKWGLMEASEALTTEVPDAPE